MATSAVRKSSRIKIRKKSFFEDDDLNSPNTAKLKLDIPDDTSNLLSFHSRENDDIKLLQYTKSFQNDAKKTYGKRKVPSESSKMCHNSEQNGAREVDEKDMSSFEASVSQHSTSSRDFSSELCTSDVHGKKDSMKSNVCNQCGISFSDLAAFKRHNKCHTGDKPFKCGQCRKSFRESCSLKRHVKIHEDERPFTCDICFKSFRDSTSFNRHQLTHVERPRTFQCPHCDKNFTDKSGLKRHERTHSGLRPYECSVCHKTFSESGSFRRHQKIHIGVRNHHCPRCRRSFMEKQSLIRHQKTVCGFWDSEASEAYQDFEMNAESAGMSQLFYADCQYTSNLDPKAIKTGGLSSASSTLHSVENHSDSASFAALMNFPAKGKRDSQKCSPSLVSLIQKDPNLYDSISEIVDSIDSYEKMLDLCGDNGQKEIDKALTREPVRMPDNLMCFECGELLVNGENFYSEGKTFNHMTNNSFRCLTCEEDEEKYGEPPVLTAEYTEECQEEQPLPVLNDESCTNILEHDGYKKKFDTFEGARYSEDKSRLMSINDFQIDNSGRPTSSHENVTYVITNSRSNTTDCASNCENIPNGESFLETECENSDNHVIPSLIPIENIHGDQAPQDNVSNMEYEADDLSIPSVFPCHLCTKVFATSAFLEQHLDLHRKSPYKCMVCNKTFNGNPALKRHMRVHTGEKPYSCPLCKKKFRDPSNFGKHKKFCSSVNGFMPSPMGSNSSNMSGMSFEENVDDIKRNTEGVFIGDEEEIIIPVQVSVKRGSINDNDDINPEFSDDLTRPFMAVVPSIDDLDDNSVDSNQNPSEENKIVYIPCEICQKLCENEQHLEMHMNYHEGNPDVTCIECGKSFSDCHGLKRHMRIHADSRPFTCDYCNRGYCDNWSLKKHKSRGCMSSEVHIPVDFLHPCQHCNRVFSEADLLEKHMTSHKGKLKFECDICFKQFSEAFNFRRHRRLHMAICPSCGMEFKNVKDMTKHQKKNCSTSIPVRSDDTSKHFPCSDCGRTYSTQAYLERHRKFHSDVKPYACEICNKRFAEAFRLRRHKKAHTKPFICQECGRGYADEAHLKRHVINNSCTADKTRGAVNFPCQYCDKIFSKNYMLVRHMNVHSQERPFSCDVCGRSYKDTSSLKRHSLIHQGVKDFICSICGKAFFYADSLKRHMSGRCSKSLKTGRYKSRKARRRNNSVNKSQKNLNKNHENQSNKISFNFTRSSGKDDRKQDMVTEKASHKSSLHTKPYMARSIDFVKVSNFRSKTIKVGPWSCVKRNHCWQCDISMPTANALLSHVNIHRHKKKFPCSHCYARFKCKVYWRVHQLKCRDSSTRHAEKLSMKFVPNPLEMSYTENERRRPRRSIPRVRWSWLTQI